MPRLPASWFSEASVTETACRLLGKVLCTRIDGMLTTGIISEAEAYHESERACHAYGRRRTRRTQTLFDPGGSAYVYLCYGIHHLFNVVTGPADVAEAVLVRGILPLEGLEFMLMRRRMEQPHPNLSAGPGTLSSALGITTRLNGHLIGKEPLWIEDRGVEIADNDVICGSRVGVDYAAEDAKLPWRFRIDAAHTNIEAWR